MSKNSKAIVTEGILVSRKEEVIKGLKEDLAREYKSIILYELQQDHEVGLNIGLR